MNINKIANVNFGRVFKVESHQTLAQDVARIANGSGKNQLQKKQRKSLTTENKAKLGHIHHLRAIFIF